MQHRHVDYRFARLSAAVHVSPLSPEPATPPMCVLDGNDGAGGQVDDEHDPAGAVDLSRCQASTNPALPRSLGDRQRVDTAGDPHAPVRKLTNQYDAIPRDTTLLSPSGGVVA